MIYFTDSDGVAFVFKGHETVPDERFGCTALHKAVDEGINERK